MFDAAESPEGSPLPVRPWLKVRVRSGRGGPSRIPSAGTATTRRSQRRGIPRRLAPAGIARSAAHVGEPGRHGRPPHRRRLGRSSTARCGQTTFIITTDHGRGSGLVEWKEHGVEEKGSENIWIAIMGPDTPALGERSNVVPVTQAQIAATLAAFLGKDYRAIVPKAAPAIAGVRKIQ